MGRFYLLRLARRSLFVLFYQPWMMDDEECGAVGRKIGKKPRNTRRNPALLPLFPPSIPHDLESNPGHRGEKWATNRLSCGTALDISVTFWLTATVRCPGTVCVPRYVQRDKPIIIRGSADGNGGVTAVVMRTGLMPLPTAAHDHIGYKLGDTQLNRSDWSTPNSPSVGRG
jgi:hypothetical protein